MGHFMTSYSKYKKQTYFLMHLCLDFVLWTGKLEDGSGERGKQVQLSAQMTSVKDLGKAFDY